MTVTQSWQRSGSAEFSVRPGPLATLITADGELDAANANHLTVFVERCVRDSSQVIVDLRSLNFFGTAGFSALHRAGDATSSVRGPLPDRDAISFPCGSKSRRETGASALENENSARSAAALKSSESSVFIK